MKSKIITLEEVKKNPLVEVYLKKADEQMDAIGYTEHGFRHASIVANIASNTLEHLGFSKREVEEAAIAGYLHDLGNVISRSSHGQTGALIAEQILRDLGMDIEEIAAIIGAIGNHEEDYGDVASPISAAVILADKADVHKSRVRNPNTLSFDIHDRINYAAEKSFLRVNKGDKTITLELKIDTTIGSVMEYFEIFLGRMVISRRAANFLGCDFKLEINGVKLL